MQMQYVLGNKCLVYKADKFREGKLKILKDFGITLTEREMEIFNTLTTTRQIENFVSELIKHRL
jgi:hypothetical protein